VVTHAEDFARGFLRLLENGQALGHAFRITFDEVLTWDQIYGTIAGALGVKAKMVHIASEFIAGVSPGMYSLLLGGQNLERGLRQQQDQILCARIRGADPLTLWGAPHPGLV